MAVITRPEDVYPIIFLSPESRDLRTPIFKDEGNWGVVNAVHSN